MDIIFTTFNARYSHTALALRCLRANLGGLHDRSAIVEFDNSLSPQAAAEKLLTQQPKLILFSVYIWNLTITEETVSILRRVAPQIRILIGGPEVSYDYDELPLFQHADHLVCGEGESIIEEICRTLLDSAPQDSGLPKVLHAPTADLEQINLPYGEYTDEDITNRRIYVETSRGCPFRCQYCLSALDTGVRFFPTDQLFAAFTTLIERGARVFKLIDRSFNIKPAHAAEILRFFLDHRRDGMMLHLEWEPERLPAELEQLIAEAPPGFLQLEIGVQTFNPEVAERIDRPLAAETIETHIRKLTAYDSTHIHADLIAGLPGETLDSIAAGFDRLHACSPDEIQLGILKKLRGAPIARHDLEWEMVYNSAPPYDVLQTSALSFIDLQRIRRFARLWDITVNNGRFRRAAPMIWQNRPSVFSAFMEWSDWVCSATHATAGIAPARLARFMRKFLVSQRGLDDSTVMKALEADLTPPKNSVAKGRERQTRHAQG